MNRRSSSILSGSPNNRRRQRNDRRRVGSREQATVPRLGNRSFLPFLADVEVRRACFSRDLIFMYHLLILQSSAVLSVLCASALRFRACNKTVLSPQISRCKGIVSVVLFNVLSNSQNQLLAVLENIKQTTHARCAECGGEHLDTPKNREQFRDWLPRDCTKRVIWTVAKNLSDKDLQVP